MMELHGVPETPQLLEGFVVMEDGLVPVIDLANLLHTVPTASPVPTLRRQIVIASHEGTLLGWITDGAVNLISIKETDLASVPEDSPLRGCAEAVFPREGQPQATLLDPARLLHEGEHAALDQMRAHAEERLAHSAAPL